MAGKVILRGLDNPTHLKEWMEAAGREFLVLRVADVLEMSEQDQHRAIEWIGLATDGVVRGRPARSPRAQIQNLGVNGYIRIPRDGICGLSMDDLAVVQQWLAVYRDVRLGKGEPSRTDPCEPCGGKGEVAGQGCGNCGGLGKIITFLELSAEESALSEGRAAP